MATSQRDNIRDRAHGFCEYCRLPQSGTSLPHEIDHIRAKKHHGTMTLQNTRWACAYCNNAKGPNASGYDAVTGRLVRLFHPRRDRWNNHFAWRGPRIIGKTPVARATIDVLNINDLERLEHRRMLIELGELPTSRE
ncbi:HNH endonuclease [Candidatus Peregrinibacteria bacterium]|nr:HNH endonuclease [Candidatus Peregrinibacteria bacterium]